METAWNLVNITKSIYFSVHGMYLTNKSMLTPVLYTSSKPNRNVVGVLTYPL